MAHCDTCGRAHVMVIKKNTGCPCRVSRCVPCEYIHGPLEEIQTVSDDDQMVEYDHEKHEGMAQCDACEEWFPPMKTVMVDEKMFIQKCLECYDGEDARAYSFSNDDIYEDYSDEIPPEEEE